MFYYFFKRELKDKYLGNLTGFAWVFIQPIITLLIYWFVFDKIFQSRFSKEQQEVGFIVYLAVGFWPWMAFSESIIKSITSVSEKKELIGKITIDLKIPVVASVAAIFFLHMLGYILVLTSLAVFNDNFDYVSIPLVVFPLLQMFCLAIAMGLLLSAIQIFVRDTLQLMTTLITLWFFLTPIIYSESFLPEKYRAIIQINPLYTPITFIQKAIITKESLPWLNLLTLSVLTGLLLFIAIRVFNKLAPSFEDFK
ncbi:O-antigen export system permease protein RfbD [hydrothermal vent metagenome]|uniref:O-antigen export system permease protein RfbD n=1 Tax=hydrothermal vent metagenome TaxID=652676 RepID=A0A3B0V3G2_9ZZZZ